MAICDCCQEAAPVLDDGVVEMCGRCTFAQLATTLEAWGDDSKYRPKGEMTA